LLALADMTHHPMLVGPKASGSGCPGGSSTRCHHRLRPDSSGARSRSGDDTAHTLAERLRDLLSEATSSLGRVITTLAVHGYRSLRDLVMPLGRLTVITGANGTGKSSLYQAFRLLSDTSGNGLALRRSPGRCGTVTSRCRARAHANALCR